MDWMGSSDMRISGVSRRLAPWFAALALLFAAGLVAAAPAPVVQIKVDASAQGTPFPHFWEQMFGSGRAVLSLRDDYRRDLDAVHRATGFQYVRFHGIFDDDVGLVQRGKDGRSPGTSPTWTRSTTGCSRMASSPSLN